jgi:hypothetical protein
MLVHEMLRLEHPLDASENSDQRRQGVPNRIIADTHGCTSVLPTASLDRS